jgi:hypothetical protein
MPPMTLVSVGEADVQSMVREKEIGASGVRILW